MITMGNKIPWDKRYNTSSVLLSIAKALALPLLRLNEELKIGS